MNNLILIGGGGHCLSCIEIIENLNTFNISGIIDINKNKNISYPIIGSDSDLEKIRSRFDYAFITIGQIKDPSNRISLYNLLKKLKYKIPKIISKNAYISQHNTIGVGSIIMNKVMLNTHSRIGENSIINTGTIIEHGASVGNNCHISTGAIVNGDVNIGNNTFIGSNTVIKEGISIGNNCVVGAGLFIKSDIENFKIIKK